MLIARPLILAAALAGAPGAFAQSYSGQMVQTVPRPTPDADALASAMRRLGANPRDLPALLEAAELSLKLGDVNAAASLLKRAENIDPMNGRVKAGMARILVTQERPGEALRYFDQAVGYGLDPQSFAGDRGLAYDLVGEQQRAQRDYRAALRAGGSDEVQRRYALSLGISGKRQEALAAIDDQVRRNDRSAWRVRAFVLAMTGDVPGAEKIASTMMPPGMGAALAPFFARVASLSAADRAFAVHFGELRATPQRLADARLAPPLPPLPPEAAPVQVAAAPGAAAMPPAGNDRRSRREEAKRRRDMLAAERRSRRSGRASTAVAAATRPSPTVVAAATVSTAVPAMTTAAAPAPSAVTVAASGSASAPASAPSPIAVAGAAPARQPVNQPTAFEPPRYAGVAFAPPRAVVQQIPAAATPLLAPPASAASAVRPSSLTAAAAAPAAQVAAASAAPDPTGTPAQMLASPVPNNAAGVTSPALPSSATQPSRSASVSAAMPSSDGALIPSAAGGGSPVALTALEPSAVAPTDASGRPAISEDTILARIMAGISIPGSELGVAPVRPPVPAPAPALAPPPASATPPAPQLASVGPTGTGRLAGKDDRASSQPPLQQVAGRSPPTAASVLAKSQRVEAVTKAAAGKTGADARPKSQDGADPAMTASDAKPSAAEKKAAAAKKLAQAKKEAEAKKASEAKTAAAKAAKAEPSRIWVQVAGGANKDDLPKAWSAAQGKAPALKGKAAYTTPLRATNRLVTGPFKSEKDAREFVNTLAKQGISAFPFTSEDGQKMARLPAK